MSKPYGDYEIERGLLALASENGVASRAVKLLKGDGVKIPPRTLEKWRTHTHRDRYERVRAEVLPKVRQESAQEHRQLERRQLELAAKLTERLKGEVETMTSKDAIQALGKADIGTGIHAEKAQLLDGEATHRPERSATEIIRALKARGFDVEGSAVELPAEALPEAA